MLCPRDGGHTREVLGGFNRHNLGLPHSQSLAGQGTFVFSLKGKLGTGDQE